MLVCGIHAQVVLFARVFDDRAEQTVGFFAFLLEKKVATQKIVWTKVDEAPALASYSLLPVVQFFLKGSGIEIEVKDISLAGRIIAGFPEVLKDDQKKSDALSELGQLCLDKGANIIKLPNISASIPQLKEAIFELQQQGYPLPNYPESPQNDTEKQIQERYAKVLGSAVNPVLREGNSDRRAPISVKSHAQKNPHKLGAWSNAVKSRVATMTEGDFYGNEKAVFMDEAQTVRIELVTANGSVKVLRDSISISEGEIVDASFMSREALRSFYARTLEEASREKMLFSLHLKATMMKVSDPVLFGHAVSVYLSDVFQKHAETFRALHVDPALGLDDLYNRINALPEDKRLEIEADIAAESAKRPGLAMVDSTKGITNLHVPSDIIIDASMPVVVRDAGKMWNREGQLQETLATIPDRSYSSIYEAVFEDCKEHGAFDPATMGTVQNIGLMAQKAQEYGSHSTTFVIPEKGHVRVTAASRQVLIEHAVDEGDIWRLSRVTDTAVQDWVKLAVNRARTTGFPAVFWLDRGRAHDTKLIARVGKYLKESDSAGLELHILEPALAMKFSLARIRQGLNTIAVTGNVLRDYLTDLFPILELGTSAKMLSIVPLLAGGGLFETGAGGSAPKHVEQFVAENYLRWDSLGEFSALGASLQHLADVNNNEKAHILAKTLDQAIAEHLDMNRSPARRVGAIDNRGSHFYLALYWARALAEQDEDREFQRRFAAVFEQLQKNEDKICAELIEVQGKPLDIRGYYHPDPARVSAAMRPSQTFNAIIDGL